MGAEFKLRHSTNSGNIRELTVELGDIHYKEGFLVLKNGRFTQYVISKHDLIYLQRVEDADIELDREFDASHA